MEKTSNKLKIIMSTVAVAFIALLIGLAFLPAVRGGATVAVAYAERDGEAMRVLGCCRAYAATHDFQTTIEGKIKARVFGIPYTLEVRGGRNVNGDEFCDVQESVSALVKKGLKRRCVGGEYFATIGEYKNKSFVYNESSAVPREQYIAEYGMPSVGICKYSLDDSVISATCAGDGVYVFKLDPHRAAAYSRNEIKTLLDCAYPEYESVELTVVSDGERVLKVTACEKFRVNKFGGTHCTLTFGETFSYPQIAG